MKLLKKNLKQGIVSITPENQDDLWYISQVIDEGDHVSGKTLRKIKKEGERKAEVEKKPIFLKIQIEKVEYGKDSTVLRASGTIVEGPDDVPRGSYHTFNIEPGRSITITKTEWPNYQIQRIEEASKEKPTKILITLFDREQAYFALMKKYGYELLSTMKGEVEKKREGVKGKEFFPEVIKQIQEYDKRHDLTKVILASPAFWKEELMKYLKDEKIKKKLIPATASGADEGSINEVLKRDEVRNALQEQRITEELELVEKLLEEISKDAKGIYGLRETISAANAGAIESLLISDWLIGELRQEGEFKELEKAMKTVEQSNGQIKIISAEHEGGQKLHGLGGIGAILRYKIEF